jgi:hypothetical protein
MMKALTSQHGDAAESDALIGNWKLVSWQAIAENEAPQNVFGSHPRGYLNVVTPPAVDTSGCGLR